MTTQYSTNCGKSTFHKVFFPLFVESDYLIDMNLEQKTQLARTDDMSKQAVCLRFRAAVKASGYDSQQAFANAAGVGVSSVNNVFKEIQYPSRQMMASLFRGHRVDFNFILVGQFNQLHSDVQDALFATLDALSNK